MVPGGSRDSSLEARFVFCCSFCWTGVSVVPVVVVVVVEVVVLGLSFGDDFVAGDVFVGAALGVVSAWLPWAVAARETNRNALLAPSGGQISNFHSCLSNLKIRDLTPTGNSRSDPFIATRVPELGRIG